MADDPTKHAIETVARRAIASGHIEWGDHPEIGEHDWQKVEAEIAKLAESIDVTDVAYEAAYEHLALRVEDRE